MQVSQSACFEGTMRQQQREGDQSNEDRNRRCSFDVLRSQNAPATGDVTIIANFSPGVCTTVRLANVLR
jgi:hypothetical protein